MPLNINQKLIDELVKREVMAAPAQAGAAPKEDGGKMNMISKMIYGAGGGADVASTLYGQHTGLVHENNPLLRGLPTAAQVPAGIGMEVGGLMLANKLLGKNHPGIMNALRLGLGALHGGLAVKNKKTINSAKAGLPNAGNPATGDRDRIPSNLVQGPDGGWYDPATFPNVGK